MKKKKTNIKTIIRQIVREEVAMAIKEVITELKQPTQSQPQPKKIVEKKQFTENSVLNDVLNETAQDGDWKTLGGGEFTSDRMNELVGRQYGDMMNGGNVNVAPQTDINDRPVTNVPDHLMDAFTKDYSKTLKAMEKSANKSRGV